MIKIFGKLRYHWQPELSVSVIYWSFVITPFLIHIALMRELIKVPPFYLALLLFCTLLAAAGFRRCFIIEKDGLLHVVSANPFKSCRIKISTITKVQVTYRTVTIFSDKDPAGKTFCMRKWPKKYFINALALEPAFKGEVQLVDHLIKLDYFETYYSDENKR